MNIFNSPIRQGGQWIDKTFIDVLHQGAQEEANATKGVGSSQGRRYMVISKGEEGLYLGLSYDKESEVTFEDLTRFVEEKLKAGGLTKEEVAAVKKDMRVVRKHHIRVRPSNPKAQFKMDPDAFRQTMGYLNMEDVAASDNVSRLWKKDIKDQKFWENKLKAITYGPEAWQDLGYPIGEVPPLPANIDGIPLLEYMKAPDPYFTDGRLRMESQRFFYVPAGVYASGPVDELNNLEKLVQHRTEGHPIISTGFTYFDPDVLAAHGGTRNEKGYWALMTVDVIDESRNKSPAVQEALIKAQQGYDWSELTPASICIFMERIRTGKCIYGQDPWTYTRLKESIVYEGERYQAVVGGSGPAGPLVISRNCDDVNRGASGLRKFFLGS